MTTLCDCEYRIGSLVSDADTTVGILASHIRVGFSSGIQGGLKDQQYLLDTLPAFLWPSDERKVEEWVACGMSMGGHQTWRLLRDGTSFC